MLKRFIFVVLIAFVSRIAAAQTAEIPKRTAPAVSEECRVEVAKGEQYLEKDDPTSYEAATHSFKKAIEAQYDCVPALVGYVQAVSLGKAFDMTFEEYSVAYEYITRALVLEPENARAYWVFADLMRHVSRPALAIKLADRAIVMNPDDPWAHYVLGSSFLVLTPADAVPEFQKALELKPGWSRVSLNLAVAYLNTEKYKDAQALLEKMLEADPQNINALTNMGIVMLRTNKADAAIEYFDKVLDLNPGFPQALKGLGDAALLKKDYQKAIDAYKRYLDSHPRDYNVLASIGRAQEAAGDIAAARASYTKAVELNPNDAETKKRLDALQAQ